MSEEIRNPLRRSGIKKKLHSTTMTPMDGYDEDSSVLEDSLPDGMIISPSGVTRGLPRYMQGVDVEWEPVLYRESGSANVHAQIALDFCGYERCRPDHSFGPIARPVHIIHTVLDGKGTLRVGDHTYEVGPDQVFILPAGVECMYSADHDHPWHYCWIGFHGSIAQRVINRIGLSKEHPVADFDGGELVENLIKNSMRYFELDIHDQLMRTGLLCTILAHMIDHTKIKHRPEKELDAELEYDEYAIRYIQMHFQEKLRISEVADKIGISRSYLVKLMKAKVGMSPQEYLTKVRMEHAAHYLNHTNDSIRDVATECGYDDSLAFSRAFRQYYGTSPTEFRVRLQNGATEDDLAHKKRDRQT